MFGLFKKFTKVGSISASEWIKKNPDKGEEILVYPKTNVEYKNPKTADNEIHPTFISSKEEIPPFYVRKIQEGKCFTGNGLVLSPDNNPFKEYTVEKEHPLKNKRHYKFNNAEKINGKVAVIATDPLNINYFHWIIEIFPRSHLLKKAGIECDKYIISCSKSFQKELLKYTGIPEDKFIHNEPNRLIQADELIVPDIINNSVKIENEKGYYYNAKYLPRWICSFYENLLKNIATATESQRIYISRNKAGCRKVQNEDEVMKLLDKYGFKKYFLEDLSAKEQINMFYNAEIVIAPHGAGLVNVLFSQQKTKIIELFPEDYLCNNLQIIAKAKGLDYGYLICKKANFSKPHSSLLLVEDLIVDIEKLDKLFKMMQR